MRLPRPRSAIQTPPVTRPACCQIRAKELEQ
jgi:hypothetical protein